MSDKNYNEILNSMTFFVKKGYDRDSKLNTPYYDKYATGEQMERDQEITELLKRYVEGYEYKVKSAKWYKGIITGLCCTIVLGFSIVLGIKLIGTDFSTVQATGLAEMIAVCITFLSSVIGILTIITKYVFPEKEEEYITRIVEIIQTNDLENKRENIKAQASAAKKSKVSINGEDIIWDD